VRGLYTRDFSCTLTFVVLKKPLRKPNPKALPAEKLAGLFHFRAMARSATLQSSSFGGDPLANLERNRAEASGKRLSKRDLLEMGNRPLSESGRRTPDEPNPALQAIESLFSGKPQEKARWSAARQAAEALFELPCTSV